MKKLLFIALLMSACSKQPPTQGYQTFVYGSINLTDKFKGHQYDANRGSHAFRYTYIDSSDLLVLYNDLVSTCAVMRQNTRKNNQKITLEFWLKNDITKNGNIINGEMQDWQKNRRFAVKDYQL